MTTGDVIFAIAVFFLTVFVVLWANGITMMSVESDCRLLHQFRYGNHVYDCMERKP